MSRRVPHSGWWGRCIREEGGEGTGTERNEFCRRTRLSMSLTAAHTVRAYGVCVCVCVCVLVLVIVFVCVCVCVCTNLLVDRSRPYDTRGNRANNTQCFLKTPPTVSVSPSILSLLACHSLLLCVSVSVSVSAPVPVPVPVPVYVCVCSCRHSCAYACAAHDISPLRDSHQLPAKIHGLGGCTDGSCCFGFGFVAN